MAFPEGLSKQQFDFLKVGFSGENPQFLTEHDIVKVLMITSKEDKLNFDELHATILARGLIEGLTGTDQPGITGNDILNHLAKNDWFGHSDVPIVKPTKKRTRILDSLRANPTFACFNLVIIWVHILAITIKVLGYGHLKNWDHSTNYSLIIARAAGE